MIKVTKEKGITLVALIITIIILIILAAVTIFAFRDSKLIEVAINGTVNYANAQVEEEYIVGEIVKQLDEAIPKIEQNGGGTPITPEQPEEPKVEGIAVEQIILNKTKTIIGTSRALILETNVLPEDATNKGIKWKSSNEEIARVNENGEVTGIKDGEVIITATAVDGSKTVSTCTINVKEELVLYNYGDTCEDVTTGWDYIGGRYYPTSYAKLQSDYIELYYGGYIATYLKDVSIETYKKVNVELEQTGYRNSWTAFQIFTYKKLENYTNEYAWGNPIEHILFFEHNNNNVIEKNIYSSNLGEHAETKAICIAASEGKDWKVYFVSIK